MKVYISGPMTGLPESNYPAFNAAEKALREAGHEPINPARAEGREGCTEWVDYMRAALRDLADADAVAVLPDWRKSLGADLEVHIALALDLDVRVLADWTGDAT